MLVLTRKENEEIVIPGLDIKIKVIKVQGSRAKLGVEAPDNIRIVRSDNRQFVETVSAEKEVRAV